MCVFLVFIDLVVCSSCKASSKRMSKRSEQDSDVVGEKIVTVDVKQAQMARKVRGV
jgi:predicted metal-binding protein